MQPIFSRNEDIDKMAFLNWRVNEDNEINNMVVMADGFLSSAIKMAKLCLIYNRDKAADILIFPILFNANHGIELYLKAIMWMLNILMNTNKRIEGSHNLKQIFQTVKSRFKAYKGAVTYQEFCECTVGLEAYINELSEKIKGNAKRDNMDFSRYPFNVDYEKHFYVIRGQNEEVDLENFVTRFEEISLCLENLSSFIYENELRDDHFE